MMEDELTVLVPKNTIDNLIPVKQDNILLQKELANLKEELSEAKQQLTRYAILVKHVPKNRILGREGGKGQDNVPICNLCGADMSAAIPGILLSCSNPKCKFTLRFP